MHKVTFIGEHDLPEGHDWVLVRDDRTGWFELLVNPAAITPELMMECWATFVAMDCPKIRMLTMAESA